MKIARGAIERFVASPDPDVRAVLLYGPDSGLVRERGRRIVSAIVGPDADPFRLAELSGKAVRDEPARLFEEAGAMSLTGGRRAIRLHDVGDSNAGGLDSFLAEDRGDTMVVVEAGELSARSSLRRLFENHPSAACIVCYGDEGKALADVIQDTLGAHGVSVDRDALAYLHQQLGGDRMVSRSELEKLALYVGDGNMARLEDAEACVGDTTTMVLDDIVDAAASGNMTGLARLLDRARVEGVEPIAVLRAMLRHISRLEWAAAQIQAGKSADDAVRSLRPPLFFRRAEGFRAQLGRWSAAAAATQRADLLEAEISCKSTGAPAVEICARALMRIALRARSHRPA